VLLVLLVVEKLLPLLVLKLVLLVVERLHQFLLSLRHPQHLKQI